MNPAVATARHVSVMVRETLEFLQLRPGARVLDATAGLGGHARGILPAILPGGILYAMDRDESSLKIAAMELRDFSQSISWIHGNFRDMERCMADHGVHEVDAILMDLGVSSYQLGESSRGFSFLERGPLDARMDVSRGFTAAQALKKLKVADLAQIIRLYGEERHARRIAAAIVEYRKKNELTDTMQLSNLIQASVGRFYRGQRLHPATRTFQALRIYVNDELGALQEALPQAIKMLGGGGRLAVISFHSLEDRIVKRTFQTYSRSMGGREGGPALIKVLTRKPVRPSLDEVLKNPRSRSARLRAVEKITQEQTKEGE